MFASDGVVVKHIIEFALPPKKRANAEEEVTATGASAASGPATEHTRSNATELASEPKKRQRKNHKDAYDVTLSQDTAQAMADSFFKFVVQEHLQQHLSRMSVWQILVLCIFHSRLSWQKGKPLELHDRDHYWIPKPTYCEGQGPCRRGLYCVTAVCSVFVVFSDITIL